MGKGHVRAGRAFPKHADGGGSGDAGWELSQDRTHNLVNETTGITEQSDPQQFQWADPVWSARGNMTSVPKPSDLTATYTATYDAWNRLAFVWVDSNSDGDHDAGETVIARYEYDGLGRRAHDRGLATTPRPRYRRAAMSYTNTLSRRRMNSLPPEIAGYAHVCDPALGIFSAPTVRCAFGSASTRYMVPFSPRQ